MSDIDFRYQLSNLQKVFFRERLLFAEEINSEISPERNDSTAQILLKMYIKKFLFIFDEELNIFSYNNYKKKKKKSKNTCGCD